MQLQQSWLEVILASYGTLLFQRDGVSHIQPHKRVSVKTIRDIGNARPMPFENQTLSYFGSSGD
jgi:hypothetical protein